MKILFLLLTVTSLQVLAEDFKETITISKKNASLKEIFRMVQKQSDYSFAYTDPMLSRARPVDIDVKNAGIEQVLSICFREQPLEYEIDNKIKIIIVKEKKEIAKVLVQPSDKKKQVKGKVTGEKGEPIAGATIALKNGKILATTDEKGEFVLNELDDEAVILISSISHESTMIETFGKNELNVELKAKVTNLDQSIVVGYTTSTRRNNVGAVSIVNGEDIQSLPTRSIDRALQGMVPGLQITSGNGTPGGAVANITLRGIATGGLGIARSPLFIIDGTPLTQSNFNAGPGTSNNPEPTNPLNQINPNDIETITVLKDAAAISIYGSQASNGVIFITTKKGKAGKFSVNFRHQTDFSGPVKANGDVLNQDQYLELLYEAYKNADATITDQGIFNDLKDKFPYRVENGDTSFYEAPNWFNELYSNKAVSISNDISFTGGSDKKTYYLSIGNISQTGVLKNTSFDRSTLRYNMAIRPTHWLNLGINSSFAYTKQKYGNQGDDITSPNGFANYVSPLLPIRQDNGQYLIYYPVGAGGSDISNPAALLDYNVSTASAYSGIGNIFGELKFLNRFTLRSSIGADFMVGTNTFKYDKRVSGANYPTGFLSELRDVRSIIIVNNTFKYEQNISERHSLKVMLNHEAQIIKQDQIQASASGFTSGFSDNELSSANNRTSLGTYSKSTFLSYFALAEYNYLKKYFTAVSYRLDGSSRFGASVPMNKFWSFGAGWVISEETFLHDPSWLNFLKLRGSVGVAGNTVAIPPSTRSNRVSGVTYTNATPLLGPSVLLSHGNPDVESEATLNYDIGLEARFWNERITFSADVYKRKTYNLVTSIPAPSLSGRTSVYANLGDIENKGVEFSLSIDVIRNKSFSWNLSGNWSTNVNKLTKASTPQTIRSSFINRVGENYESWYLNKWAGVDPTDGSAQYTDTTGKTVKIFSNANRVIVGKPQPDGYGGLVTTFKYKQLELSAFFYYAYGYKVYNSYLNAMINDGFDQPYSNQSVLALNRWQKPGDIAMNPKRVLDNPMNDGIQPSTRYLIDGDHIRLKNLSLGYFIPKTVITKLKITNAKVYAQINNLGFLWRSSSELDPENTGQLGEYNSAYPQQRSLSIGINLTF